MSENDLKRSARLHHGDELDPVFVRAWRYTTDEKLELGPAADGSQFWLTFDAAGEATYSIHIASTSRWAIPKS